MRTLTDAILGTVAYWEANPDGGSAAGLRGFLLSKRLAEPLVTEWLAASLPVLFDLDYIQSPEYSELKSKVVRLGPTLAGKGFIRVMILVSQDPALLDIQTQLRDSQRRTEGATLTAQRAALQAAARDYEARTPVSPGSLLLLTAARHLNKRLSDQIERLQRVAGEE